MTIPRGAEGLTPEWFADNLGWDVASCTAEEIGVGIGVSSAVHRVTLTCGGEHPASVVVKLTAVDEAATVTCTVLSMYRREVAFFEQVAHDTPMRVPVGHFGEVSNDGSQVVLVMEDMSGNRAADQTSAMSLADAERCIDSLADWHAKWWGQTDGMVESGVAIALTDPLYPAILPGLFEEGWAKLNASTQCQPPAPLTTIGKRFSATIGKLLDSFGEGPQTLLHGDYRADNLMFGPDDEPIALDFQLIGTGTPAYDLAYFVTASLEVTASEEKALFARWADRLVASGIAASDMTDMWDRYRRAALFRLIPPVSASRGRDLNEPRQAALCNAMMAGTARAATDLNLEDLLE